EDRGQRYLAPAAQLVGIEAHVADINENLTQSRRDKQRVDLKFRFFTEVNALVAKETFGYTSLDKVVKLKDTFFKDQNAGEDVLPQVQNELTIDLDNFTNLNREMQFISGPTLSGKAVKPRKAIIIAFAFVMGFFIFVFLAFFVEWWTQNKKKIIA
ncbi:MAG: hypothetical protein GY950_08070, partial [bacterium]|nr:hypothetical protein [bacterium]